MAARTEGVTASFLEELLRRAALLAADASTGTGSRVTNPRSRWAGAHVNAALAELEDTRNAMTRVLLGAGRDRFGDADGPTLET